MSSIYFPVRVAAVLRSIFHVFSGLSISNHYLSRHNVLDAQRRDTASQDALWSNDRRQLATSWKLLRSVDWSYGLQWPRSQSWYWTGWDAVSPEVYQNDAQPQPSSKGWNWPPFLFSNKSPSPPSPETSDSKGSPSSRRDMKERNFDSFDFPVSDETDVIHQLLQNPALFDPLRTPRYPIVLCHGLYGFDTRGPTSFPSLRMHYWSNVLSILRQTVRAEVIVTSVPGTASISSRAEKLDRQLRLRAYGRGVNFLAHSMGGLDCRHLISHLHPDEYTPLSLTTIATPHRGSPFMDWCAENLGLGNVRDGPASKQPRQPPPTKSDERAKAAKSESNLFSSALPSSLTTLLLNVLDSPAYANLTTRYLNDVFNPSTPNVDGVKYFSVAGRLPSVSIWHPFWLPKMVLDGVEERERERMRRTWQEEIGLRWEQEAQQLQRPLWAKEDEWGNDGLVTVQSAKWGEFLGIMEGSDHWELRGARGLEFGVDFPAFPAIGLGPPRAVTPDKKGAAKAKQVAANAEEAYRKASPVDIRAASKAADDAIKASTDKLSTIVDWLVEQVPSVSSPILGAKVRQLVDTEGKQNYMDGSPKGDASEMRRQMDREGRSRKKNELKAKEDLERFYVALSRKMYDEGL